MTQTFQACVYCEQPGHWKNECYSGFVDWQHGVNTGNAGIAVQGHMVPAGFVSVVTGNHKVTVAATPAGVPAPEGQGTSRAAKKRRAVAAKKATMGGNAGTAAAQQGPGPVITGNPVVAGGGGISGAVAPVATPGGVADKITWAVYEMKGLVGYGCTQDETTVASVNGLNLHTHVKLTKVSILIDDLSMNDVVGKVVYVVAKRSAIAGATAASSAAHKAVYDAIVADPDHVELVWKAGGKVNGNHWTAHVGDTWAEMVGMAAADLPVLSIAWNIMRRHSSVTDTDTVANIQMKLDVWTS